MFVQARIDEISGGAAGTKKYKVTKAKILQKIRTSPKKYRVGATGSINNRICNYPLEFAGRKVYYAETRANSCLKKWENEALELLSPTQTHIQQKQSKISEGKKGFLYIIDMN